MDEVKKILQNLSDGQKLLAEDINDLRKEMKQEFQKVYQRFEKVDNRLDRLGKQVAFLEDDASTREEHDELDKRLTKVEKKVASI